MLRLRLHETEPRTAAVRVRMCIGLLRRAIVASTALQVYGATSTVQSPVMLRLEVSRPSIACEFFSQGDTTRQSSHVATDPVHHLGR